MIRKLDDYVIAAVTVACVVGFSILACSKTTPKEVSHEISYPAIFEPLMHEWQEEAHNRGYTPLHDVSISVVHGLNPQEPEDAGWCSYADHKITLFLPVF